MEIVLLRDILIILGIAIAVVFVFRRLKVPTVVGLLLTGVLAGPHGLGLVHAVHEVEVMAEIGVVLLLFTIGIEFSLKKLIEIKRAVLVGGALQVTATSVAAASIAFLLGFSVSRSIFMGLLISLSSTAIVLKILQERAEMDSPHGRTTLGILLFQDIIIVPMILFTPILAGAEIDFGYSLLLQLGKSIGVIALTLFASWWLVPLILFQAARMRDRELFILSIVFIGLAVAWVTSAVGLSLALGAFLAGLIISESEYSFRALSSILPFRDIFTSIFFVSVGMLLDARYVALHPWMLLLLALGVIAFKTITAGGPALLLGLPLRSSILIGIGLAQVGEFSFILSMAGLKYKVLDGDIYQMFLGYAILTMIATPFLISAAPWVADTILKLPLPGFLTKGSQPEPDSEQSQDLSNHLIIVGFGPSGQKLALAAKNAGIFHIIIEMNPETVRGEKAKGQPIIYGDASQEAVLKHVGIEAARVIVVVISDPAATRRVTEVGRRLNPGACIIVRTRFIKEVEPLYKLGASEVIPEEFETSVEIFARVLNKYLVPRDEIDKFIAEVREEGYQMFRKTDQDLNTFSDLKLYIPEFEVGTYRVCENSPVLGKSIAELDFRNLYGITLLAISRGSQVISNPNSTEILHSNDILVILGSPEQISATGAVCQAPNLEEKEK